jgi:hypothetical protein
MKNKDLKKQKNIKMLFRISFVCVFLDWAKDSLVKSYLVFFFSVFPSGFFFSVASVFGSGWSS